MAEVNFDGIVGPTHNYAGLARGNLASMSHGGQVSNPRAAALEGITKMRSLRDLGVAQAVLPPHFRPAISTLRRLGFSGDDRAVLSAAATGDGHLLRLCSSASAMWTANAATVAPAADTEDGRLHLTPANLSAMFHRSVEAATTTRVLKAIFSDQHHFVVHDPLPAGQHFADEGAANHTRFCTEAAAVHLFGWGRRTWGESPLPGRYPARQSYEASRAIARLHRLRPGVELFWQQDPIGIDSGAFHSDVLAVGNQNFFMLHEHAFVEHDRLLERLQAKLDGFVSVVALESELPVRDAVAAYPFNSQIVTLPNGRMTIVAPRESEHNAKARRFLDRVVSEENPIDDVVFLDVNASMQNGGGPACLRLRIELDEPRYRAVGAKVFFDAPLERELVRWIERHYRDRLSVDDLADPQLLDEVRACLDELTQILALGSVYDFQLAS